MEDREVSNETYDLLAEKIWYSGSCDGLERNPSEQFSFRDTQRLHVKKKSKLCLRAKVLLRQTIPNILIGSKFADKLTPWRQQQKVHHRIHNSSPKVSILSQVNPLHNTPDYLPKIHSNPSLLSMPPSSKWSLSFGLSHQNFVQVSPLSYARHMPCPPHYP
jgi:hypothetical protein